jgi:4-aminobutyrate aminotransferase-like enzyme
MTAGRSTIMDTNSFRAENADALDDVTRSMTAQRSELLGASYRLFYRNPVHVVRGYGAYLWDADGNKFLDVYNNVPSVGHAHPRVVEAITRQASLLNTHTRYLHGAILAYAEDLLSTLPDEIDQVMFMCTGSEANDLAIRVAREYSGGRGIIVTSESYHGNTELTSAHSPALGSSQVVDSSARLIAPPDTYHVADVGRWFAEEMQRVIDQMRADGIPFAGFLADSIFSSDGVFAGEPGMLAAAIDVVHANGGVYIADEVQPGFARTGDAFWGFGRHGIVPDIVTMGKPMGNGMPISAMAAKREVLEAFTLKTPYFNTFGGNPVSIAAAQAVLDVIRDEGLQSKARVVGGELREALRELATRYEVIGDVRGAGQFTGLELVTDRASKLPATSLALDVIEGMRERGVLTSVAGQGGNVLKLRPPLAFDSGDIGWLVGALDESLAEALRSTRSAS